MHFGRSLFCLCLFFTTSVHAGPLLERWLGEGSELRLDAGLWAAKWFPVDIGDLTVLGGQAFENKIDWSLLQQVGLKLHITDSTAIGVEYITDKLFSPFESDMRQSLSSTERQLVNLLMGQLKQRIWDIFHVYARITFGKFTGNLTSASYFQFEDQAFPAGTPAQWYTDFFDWEIAPGVEMDLEGMNLFVGLGIRHLSYRFPWLGLVEYGNATTVTVDGRDYYDDGTAAAPAASDLNSWSAGLYLFLHVKPPDYDKMYFDVTWLTSFGSGTMSNRYFDLDLSVMAMDTTMTINWELSRSSALSLDVYFGLRFLMHFYKLSGGDYSSAGEYALRSPLLVHAADGTELHAYPEGHVVEVEPYSNFDFFIGPVLGLRAVF